MNAAERVCTHCGAIYQYDDPSWRCACGGVFDIRHNPVFDLTLIWERPPGMWRYRDALPLAENAPEVSLGEPMTPLVPIEIGGRSILIKQEQLFPTGSFKDRGAALLISYLKSIGIREIIEDSSGNAGSAIAAYAARAGIACKIVAPESTSSAKLAMIRAFGAELELVPGNRQAAADRAMELAETVSYASHSWNPFFFHGTKTVAFEICQQMGWRAPDTVVFPVGNGTLLLGAFIGFKELKDSGLIQRVPRIIAVQSAACDPLTRAFRQNGDTGLHPKIEPVPSVAPGLAEGIAVVNPIRGRQILQAVRDSGGLFISVPEEEIQQALEETGRQGSFIESSSAAAIAGLKRYIMESARKDESILSVFTGHGLKDSR